MSTTYDDVHRTLLTDCKELVIAIVNEIFHTQYTGKEKVILLQNEVFLRQQETEEKKITDSSFKIVSMDGQASWYHLECQSTTDGSMIVRMWEYDSQIALQNGEWTTNQLEVTFPESAVLYLRHKENTPDVMKMVIHTPGGSVSYDVPILKVQQYSIDEIFEKKLYYLIPFYIFSYEKNFSLYEEDKDKLRELTTIYSEISKRLQQCNETGTITEYTKLTIIEMSKRVIDAIAEKYQHVKEGVENAMGGKILEYEAKNILIQGRQENGIEVFLRALEKGFTQVDAQELAGIDEQTVEIALKQKEGIR